jgi:hypothetical protein
MSDDKGFFGGLADSIFGDDDDTPVLEPARPPVPAPPENMSVDPDRGGMSIDPDEGGMSVDDNGDTGESGRRVSENDDGDMSVDPGEGGMSIDPNEGGMSSATDGPNMSIAPAMDLAEDICLWPHSIIQLIDLALGNDPINTAPASPPIFGGSFEVHRYGEYSLPKRDFQYFEIKTRGLFEVAGKWTPHDGVAVAGYDQGVVAGLQQEFKSDDQQWSVTPKLKVGFPFQKVNDKTQTAGVAIGFEASFLTKCQDIPITISIEILAAAVEWERPDKNAEWEISAGNLEATLSGAAVGTVKDPGGMFGSFEGTLKVSGKVVVEPNWSKILQEAIKQYGADLTFEAAATAALSVAIVAGGVATIVIGVMELLEAWKLTDMRDRVIPERANAGTKGYMDGIHGRAAGKSGSKLASGDAAYESCAALGKQRRLKLIAEKCENDPAILDRWLATHEKEVVYQARSIITVKLQQDLFN